MIKKFNPEKFNVRLALPLLLGMLIFYLLIIFKFLIPDSFIKLELTRQDSGVIASAKEITYIEISPIKRQKLKRQALEIIMYDKPYKIWLTDLYNKKYWKVLSDTQNVGDTIKFNYVDRLNKEGILHNPKRILIGDNEIIGFNRIKNESKYALLFIMLLLIPCLVFFIILLRTYILKLLKQDIERLRRFILSFQ